MKVLNVDQIVFCFTLIMFCTECVLRSIFDAQAELAQFEDVVVLSNFVFCPVGPQCNGCVPEHW